MLDRRRLLRSGGSGDVHAKYSGDDVNDTTQGCRNRSVAAVVNAENTDSAQHRDARQNHYTIDVDG